MYLFDRNATAKAQTHTRTHIHSIRDFENVIPLLIWKYEHQQSNFQQSFRQFELHHFIVFDKR